MYKQPKTQTTAGFTTIELVVTIVVVAILAVSIAPRFFPVSIYSQQLYYDQVLNTLRYARKLSIETGSHIQVVPSTSPNQIELRRRTVSAGCTNTTVAISDPASRSSSFLKVAPNNVSLTFSSNWPLYFNGLGQVFRASDCAAVSTLNAAGTENISVTGNPIITLWGETGFAQ